jgi:hypothetical protein
MNPIGATQIQRVSSYPSLSYLPNKSVYYPICVHYLVRPFSYSNSTHPARHHPSLVCCYTETLLGLIIGHKTIIINSAGFDYGQAPYLVRLYMETPPPSKNKKLKNKIKSLFYKKTLFVLYAAEK